MPGYLARSILTPPVSQDVAVPFPYLKKEHVHVYKRGSLDGGLVEQATPADFTWTSGSIIHLTSAVMPAQLVVQRITPNDALVAVPTGTGTVTSTNLKAALTQLLYLGQEGLDSAVDVQLALASTLRDPVGAAINALPSAANRALKALTFDNLGQPLLILTASLGGTGTPGSSDGTSVRVAKNADFSIADTDYGKIFSVDASGGAVVVTFPLALGASGLVHRVTIHRDPADATTNPIIIKDDGGNVAGVIVAACAMGYAPSLIAYSDGSIIICYGVE